MNGKLSDAQLETLRQVDGNGRVFVTKRGTVRSLWRRGLIADRVANGRFDGYMLTAEGRLALQHGRQMLSGRTP